MVKTGIPRPGGANLMTSYPAKIMKFNVHENYKAAFLIALVLASLINLSYRGYLQAEIPNKWEAGTAASWNWLMAILTAILVLAFVAELRTISRIRLIEKTQAWLVDTVNWNIEQLKIGDLEGKAGETDIEGITSKSRWPWGSHHTETLGHLEAAARKWWVLYDPRDFTTAPTNEMVSEWLQTERGISREKARAIASMLRPDGLPTGPRR